MTNVISLPLDPWDLRVRQSAARLLAREPRLRRKLLRTDVNRTYALALVDKGMTVEDAEREAKVPIRAGVQPAAGPMPRPASMAIFSI